MSKPENRPDTPSLSVDIISDVMCPWCFIGQKNLERAMAIAGEVPAKIRWHPFQLDPTLPLAGKPRAEYLNDKFGGEERARAIYKRVEDAGRASGIDFAFDRIAVSPNTLDAHRLIRWAGGLEDDTQDRLVRRLFEMYFIEGRNIGDRKVLVEAAEAAGMDGALVAELLATDRDKAAVEAEIARAQQMGVTGVPCFIIGGKYAVSGAQPPEVLASALRQTAAELEEERAFQNTKTDEKPA